MVKTGWQNHPHSLAVFPGQHPDVNVVVKN